MPAALIKLDSPGPVLVKQERVGLNGAEFRFLKFRTMHHRKKKHDMRERLPIGDLTAACSARAAARPTPRPSAGPCARLLSTSCPSS